MTAPKPQHFDLSSLLPARVKDDKPGKGVSTKSKMELRARMMAQEWMRNGQDLPGAYAAVTKRNRPRSRTLSVLTAGNEDIFIDEVKDRFKASGVDKEAVLNFLWALIESSLLDFFDEHGRILPIAELKKMPRIYQRMITEMSVKTVEIPVLDELKRPMCDDVGRPYLRVESSVRIKMPEKLAALQQLATIMKWVGAPSVVINDHRTVNVGALMADGDSRKRNLEKSYSPPPIEGEFTQESPENSHE